MRQKECTNHLTSTILIYINGGSNGPNNTADVAQPGSREWRETDFTYIVIVDTTRMLPH
jgi:hypothetical protein